MLVGYSLFLYAILITGSRLYQLGETANITCFALVPVDSIQWINESNGVNISSNTDPASELEISFKITSNRNNTVYTCRISSDGIIESINITVYGKEVMFLIGNLSNSFFPSVVTIEIETMGTQIEGSWYTLTCNVSEQSLMATVTYEWLNNSNSLQAQTDNKLDFNPIDRYDSGNFTC